MKQTELLTIEVTRLIEGSKFKFSNEFYEVTENNGEIVEAKSLSNKLGIMLTTGNKVEIDEDVKEIYEYKFKQTSKNHFQLTRQKISRPF